MVYSLQLCTCATFFFSIIPVAIFRQFSFIFFCLGWTSILSTLSFCSRSRYQPPFPSYIVTVYLIAFPPELQRLVPNWPLFISKTETNNSIEKVKTRGEPPYLSRLHLFSSKQFFIALKKKTCTCTQIISRSKNWPCSLPVLFTYGWTSFRCNSLHFGSWTWHYHFSILSFFLFSFFNFADPPFTSISNSISFSPFYQIVLLVVFKATYSCRFPAYSLFSLTLLSLQLLARRLCDLDFALFCR